MGSPVWPGDPHLWKVLPNADLCCPVETSVASPLFFGKGKQMNPKWAVDKTCDCWILSQMRRMYGWFCLHLGEKWPPFNGKWLGKYSHPMEHVSILFELLRHILELSSDVLGTESVAHSVVISVWGAYVDTWRCDYWEGLVLHVKLVFSYRTWIVRS